MYSEEDLTAAVAAGAITAEAAEGLRAHVSAQRQMPRGDEESFRLVNSFNDIFVAIGAVIMLIAAGAIGQWFGAALAPSPDWPMSRISDAEMQRIIAGQRLSGGLQMLVGALLVAGTAWGLAEFFTKRRHMALPSIILLLAFVFGVFAAVMGLAFAFGDVEAESTAGFFAAGAGLLAAGAAWLHWRRFMVPITIAAGAAALAITVIALVAATVDVATDIDGERVALWLVFVAGLAIFALAMRWDMSDRDRTTRRSDVAFWLHLLAAPMIAHPIFTALGVMDGGDNVGIASAIGVLAIYVLFGIVALAIDRRALLVSALAYVLAALTLLFDRFGAVELNFALTALVIGSALLTLAGFWGPIRARVVGALPLDMRSRLPSALPA